MAILNAYNDFIIKAIIKNQDTITEVHSQESLKSLVFDREQYPNIALIIKSKSWETINELSDNFSNDFREYLNVIKFKDQYGKTFIITIYDSDEMWQDPQIIELFPMDSE